MRDGLTEKQRFWLDQIESCEASGMSTRAYADHHGLDVQQFYGWKNKLKTLGVLSESGSAGPAQSPAARLEAPRAKQRSACFIRADIMPASASPDSSSAARIILANGITIDAPEGIKADALGTLIVAAQQVATVKGGSGA